ncbi:MAG: hypothetical protein PHV18_11155 [Lachnospiraceae bacterium]|nr:hypothetical protein [Lachnospiraceae bacterium]
MITIKEEPVIECIEVVSNPDLAYAQLFNDVVRYFWIVVAGVVFGMAMAIMVAL